jgi:hypothetical protein
VGRGQNLLRARVLQRRRQSVLRPRQSGNGILGNTPVNCVSFFRSHMPARPHTLTIRTVALPLALR